MHAQVLVDLLRESGPMTRAEIARRCSVSKPTASSLVDRLLRSGLVVERGTASEGSGRPGRLVAYHSGAGRVVGIDVGGTSTRAALADLDGRWLRVERVPTVIGEPKGLARQIADLVRSLVPDPAERARVLEIAIATPGVVDLDRRRIAIAPNLPAVECEGFLDQLEAAVGQAPILINDVKVATAGEFRSGAGRDARDLAYLSIGTGLGLGLVADGRLHHGSGGRAGEIGLLMFPGGGRERLEDGLSGVGIAKRHRAAGGSGRPEDAFSEFELGRAPGQGVVAEFLRLLAWAAAVVATVHDPERIVVGGGVGLRCAPFLPDVRRAVELDLGYAPDITPASLGDDAGLTGAIALALDPARSVGRWLKGGSVPASA